MNKNRSEILKIVRHAVQLSFPKASNIAIRDTQLIKTAMTWKSVVLRARCSFLVNGRGQTIDLFGGWDKENPASKKRADKTIKHLWMNGFSVAPYLVPQPLLFDQKTSLLLYVSYPGETLYNLLRRKKNGDFKRLISLIGSWTAGLHSLRPKNIVPRLSNADDKLQHKRNCATFSGNGFSFFAKKPSSHPLDLSNAIFQQRCLIRKQLKALSLIHNDLHIRNILTNERRDEIAVIDFNESRLHDPLDDIAAFLVHLDVELARFFSKQEVSHFQKTFLRSYLSTRKKKFSADEIRRLSAHAAWTSLRFLQYTLESNPPFPHRHSFKKSLCRIEERFWEIAINPDKFIKPLL